jgi:allophanate hydrolase
MTTTDTPCSPTERVTAAYRRITEVDRPEVWITLRDRADVLADAGAVEQRLGSSV